MKDQFGPLLAVLLICLAGVCVVLGVAAYERELSKKQVSHMRRVAIIYMTGNWVLLILMAVCFVFLAFN